MTSTSSAPAPPFATSQYLLFEQPVHEVGQPVELRRLHLLKHGIRALGPGGAFFVFWHVSLVQAVARGLLFVHPLVDLADFSRPLDPFAVL